MTTFFRIGNRVFSMDQVEEIKLDYDPKRYDKTKPPSQSAGVEIILVSGRRLDPLWDEEAQALRDYLEAKPVEVRVFRDGAGIQVLHLLPAAVEDVAASPSLTPQLEATP